MENANQLIGCCGLNCETCDARITTLTNDNARVIKLYEKYGFQKLCTFPKFFKIKGEESC